MADRLARLERRGFDLAVQKTVSEDKPSAGWVTSLPFFRNLLHCHSFFYKMNMMHASIYNTNPLDPGLLITSFRLQTRWYVLTGAACVGKTTLLEALAAQGYSVITESARAFFECELAKGRSLADIRANDAALQRGILALQLSHEHNVPHDQLTFLDRAVPDQISFYRLLDLDISEVLPQCFHHRYTGVFILDRLPLHRDQTLGPEDDTASDFLDKWLERDYASLGYPVTRVPVLSPAQRLAFILDRLDG